MDSKKKKIIIVAGEASGDVHGANLAKELFSLRPDLKIFGLGGKRMQQAGVETIYDIADTSVVGATEVISRLPSIWRVFRGLSRTIKKKPPDLLVLIDFPDFNLMLAKVAKRAGVKIVYYISPQVWAWRSGRVNKIARLVKKILVILPFEKEIYKKAGVECEFVGHPLLDEVIPEYTKKDAVKKFGLRLNKPIFGLLPGSRKNEIDSLLDPILGSAKLIKDMIPDAQFILPIAPGINITEIKDAVDRSGLSVSIIEGNAVDAINISDMIIVASGTTTLQAAILGVPMVIIYRISLLSYIIGKLLIKVKDIGLVNIVAGKRIVPELLQNDVNPEMIFSAFYKIYNNPEDYKRTKEELKKVMAKLGKPGASRKAAVSILKTL
ncbi:MAG: lipid-A-disaccharide synthase [Nitrospirae bacterium]|nr:lipid-A-disaccharide synthase [Nitrospirota bacterium]